MTATWAWRQLHDGASEITIKPRGKSMTPLIKDGQEVTVDRLADDDVLAVGDIVLARVRGHVYLHKITAIDGDRVQISNNHGRINGWTHRDKVAGKLRKL